MVLLDKVRFDFQMSDERFARDLYGRWDEFCRISFTEVADDVLSGFERPQEMVYVEKLSIDLGVVHEKDFYTSFPSLLRERLKAAFREHMRQPGRYGDRVMATNQGCLEWISYYLLHGSLRWDTPEEFRLPAKLFSEVLKDEQEALIRFFRQEGHRENLRRRLVMQFDNEVIEAVILLTERYEPKFICSYVRVMLDSYPHLYHPGIVKHEYREAVWLLVLAYLWSESKGFFSRKQLVRYTIAGLAAHYGIDFDLLLSLLTKCVKERMVQREEGQGLLRVLFELSQENMELPLMPVARQRLWIAYLKGHTKSFPNGGCGGYSGKSTDRQTGNIWQFLSSPQSCHCFLNLLAEAEIEKLVGIIIPGECDFVVSYARQLEKEKERGMFEGKAGGEFRLVKWKFIFAVVLECPASGFVRKHLIKEVLQRLSAHYGLNYLDIVEYFYRGKEFLPEELQLVLMELYREMTEDIYLKAMIEKPSVNLPVERRVQLIWLLSHPQSCRSLLSRLEEEKIYRLTDIVLSPESGFIIAYARQLQQEKERGIFEGKAGSDFRVIKWEFIFLVALSDGFSRKYFVSSVLLQLSAHYGVGYSGLLDYFYRNLPRECPELQVVINGLWQESHSRETLPQLATLNKEVRELFTLESFLIMGIPVFSAEELHRFFVALSVSVPDELADSIKKAAGSCWVDCPGLKETYGSLYASVILWYIRKQGGRFRGYMALMPLLVAVESGKVTMGVVLLRRLLVDIVNGREQKIVMLVLSGGFLPDKLMRDPEISAIRYLLVHCDVEEVGIFIRGHKDLFRKIFFSSGEMVRQVLLLMECNKKIFTFLCKLYGEKVICEVMIRNGKEKREAGKSLLQYVVENEKSPDVIVIIKYELLNDAGVLLKEWQNMPFAGQKRIVGLLSGNQHIQRLWIYRIGTAALREVTAGLLLLQKRLPFYWDENKVLSCLMEYTLKSYANFSATELFTHFRRFLLTLLDDSQLRILDGILTGFASEFPFCGAAMGLPREKTGENPLMKREDRAGEKLYYVNNAGLVLLSPWFPMLFERLNLLADKREFTGIEMQIKAIFLLQSLLYKENQFEEHTLVLNKILTGWELEEPLPLIQETSVQERELLDGMLGGVLQNWNKMKNTSVEGFRQSFLLRDGKLEENASAWTLTVDERGYDVLLDSLPWGYNFVKYPWMDKPLNVIWH